MSASEEQNRTLNSDNLLQRKEEAIAQQEIAVEQKTIFDKEYEKALKSGNYKLAANMLECAFEALCRRAKYVVAAEEFSFPKYLPRQV